MLGGGGGAPLGRHNQYVLPVETSEIASFPGADRQLHRGLLTVPLTATLEDGVTLVSRTGIDANSILAMNCTRGARANEGMGGWNSNATWTQSN